MATNKRRGSGALITIIVLLILASAALGGYYLYQKYQQRQRQARADSLKQLEALLDIEFMTDAAGNEVTAFEYGSGTYTVSSLVKSYTEGAELSVNGPAIINTSSTGLINVDFILTATDEYGQRAVKTISKAFTVRDSKSPVITLYSPTVTISAGTAFNPEMNIMNISDPVDGLLTYSTEANQKGTYYISSQVDPNTPGTYKVAVTATDLSGNTAHADFTVVVLPPEDQNPEADN